MDDLWESVGTDEEAVRVDALTQAARKRAAKTVRFLLSATSARDLEHRIALTSESLDRAVEASTPDGVDFAVVRAHLEDAISRDHADVLSAREAKVEKESKVKHRASSGPKQVYYTASILLGSEDPEDFNGEPSEQGWWSPGTVDVWPNHSDVTPDVYAPDSWDLEEGMTPGKWLAETISERLHYIDSYNGRGWFSGAQNVLDGTHHYFQTGDILTPDAHAEGFTDEEIAEAIDIINANQHHRIGSRNLQTRAEWMEYGPGQASEGVNPAWAETNPFGQVEAPDDQVSTVDQDFDSSTDTGATGGEVVQARRTRAPRSRTAMNSGWYKHTYDLESGFGGDYVLAATEATYLRDRPDGYKDVVTIYYLVYGFPTGAEDSSDLDPFQYPEEVYEGFDVEEVVESGGVLAFDGSWGDWVEDPNDYDGGEYLNYSGLTFDGAVSLARRSAESDVSHMLLS